MLIKHFMHFSFLIRASALASQFHHDFVMIAWYIAHVASLLQRNLTRPVRVIHPKAVEWSAHTNDRKYLWTFIAALH